MVDDNNTKVFEDLTAKGLVTTGFLAFKGLAGLTKASYIAGRTLIDKFSPTRNSAVVGKHKEWGLQTWNISIPYANRSKDVQIIGPTGSGKTVLMKNLAIADMQTDAAVIVIDPKGDTAKELLGHIPPQRQHNAVYFDITDTDMPIGLNLLHKVPPHLRTRAISDVVMTFKKLFHRSWGVRMEHFLRMAVAALIDNPEVSTLLDIPRLFLNIEYRNRVLTHVRNPLVQWFWENEFPAIAGRRSYIMVIEPILNKLSMLNFPEVANVIGQAHSKLDLASVIKSGGTILAHIPQSKLGEDISQFLCAILFTYIQLLTMAQPSGATKRLCLLHADEFQTYLSGSFEKALTEGRSFNLCLCLAHQFSQQLDRSLRQALDHNIAVRLTCQFVKGRHYVWFQKLQDHIHEPEMLIPLPPPGSGNLQVARAVRLSSRRQYGRPKGEIEANIIQRLTLENENIVNRQPRNNDGLAVEELWSD